MCMDRALIWSRQKLKKKKDRLMWTHIVCVSFHILCTLCLWEGEDFYAELFIWDHYLFFYMYVYKPKEDNSCHFRLCDQER